MPASPQASLAAATRPKDFPLYGRMSAAQRLAKSAGLLRPVYKALEEMSYNRKDIGFIDILPCLKAGEDVKAVRQMLRWNWGRCD